MAEYVSLEDVRNICIGRKKALRIRIDEIKRTSRSLDSFIQIRKYEAGINAIDVTMVYLETLQKIDVNNLEPTT